MKFKNIISDGTLQETSEESIKNIIDNLRTNQNWLHDQKVDDLLNYFDLLGKTWKNNSSNLFGNNLKYLSDFMKKEHLSKELKIALRGNYHSLDEFVELFDDSELFYHAQPRGISVHWIAGNVDVLGVFSVIQALLTKNLCLIKAPHNYNTLKNLLQSFGKVSTEKLSGNQLLKCIALVYVEKNDLVNQEALSKNADIRIAWGGEEAVSTILSLKKNFFTEDIIYGPKYSYAILDSKILESNSKSIAQRLAMDISIFDQYACNSPHTIFIENSTKDDNISKNFAKDLATAMDSVNRLMIPKSEISEKKSMDILSIRTEYDFKGEVYSSKNTDWTVIYSNEQGLATPYFSRVVFVRPIDDATYISKYHNKKIQSIGLEISDLDKKKKLADYLTISGGDRCPSIGKMSIFHSPWDGMFGMDRMIRWITISRNEK